MHTLVMKHVKENQFAYVVRHHFLPDVSEEFQLPGYGVELAIKRTDYIVVDDTKVDGVSQRLSRMCTSASFSVLYLVWSRFVLY